MSILATALCQNKTLPLYSNYELRDALDTSSVRDILEIENGLIALDELWVSLDSRSWKDNVFLTRWINQTRKKNLLVFYTTQHFGQIDIRVRRATDSLIFCEHFKPSARIRRPFFRYTFLSNALVPTILKSYNLLEERAADFYNIYDSFQLIRPLKQARPGFHKARY
jgi:hypothetical protein